MLADQQVPAGRRRRARHVRAWGPRAPFEVLLGKPRAGEEVAGEETRLGALAARLWLPLLAAEGSV
ncbi:hypothetical protein TMLG_03381 [Mycobacterium tuberculosis SUMu012]|nr:hypothetical protein TMLG_03381 [Mycobacterium tuberculosis SUMu012]